MPNSSRRSNWFGPSLRWFVDEDGSTLLAAMLAVVLSVVMLATGLQWYWVSSSSCDIQSVADLGALAGADAIAKTVTVVQVLDFVLLSMNFMAMVLHVIVVVSGVVLVTSAPVGGAGMAPIFRKAVEFDRKFIDIRKRLANDAFTIARTLSDAAPYLAMGQAYRIINKNSAVLAARVGTGFAGMVVPFPLQGEVSLSTMPANERALADLAGSANGQNAEDAERLAELEAQLEAARLQCWEADVFRSPATPQYGWSPTSAIADFEGALADVAATVPDAVLPASIGGTAWSDDVLEDRYRADYAEIGLEVRSRFTSAANSRDGEYLDPGDISEGYLLESALAELVYVVEHEAGERKAYHSAQSCSGLSNATTAPAPVPLEEIVDDSSHPPCSLCAPTHWSAISEWRRSLGSIVPSWNAEAECIRSYEAIREEMKQLRDGLASRTGAVLDEILGSASAYLRGGRLTYRPAGSRGIVCVVTSNQTRKLPAFTMPTLTGGGGRVLGRQIAFAGAALSEGGGDSSASQAIRKLSSDVGIGKTANLSGSVMLTLGLSDGVASALAPLWRSGLSMLHGESTQVKGSFDALPWGLDSIVRGFMDSAIDAAGVSKPDTRQVIPVLTSISEVGDPSAPGLEGQFVNAVRGARDAYSTVGELSGVTSALSSAGFILSASSTDALLASENPRLAGKSFRIPFDEWSLYDGFKASTYAAGGLSGALAVP